MSSVYIQLYFPLFICTITIKFELLVTYKYHQLNLTRVVSHNRLSARVFVSLFAINSSTNIFWGVSNKILHRIRNGARLNTPSEAYIQSKVIIKTLESITQDYRRGIDDVINRLVGKEVVLPHALRITLNSLYEPINNFLTNTLLS